MTAYTQLNEHEIQQLADSYDLEVAEFSPLDGGNANSSYTLKTPQGAYVLTVCDDKTFDEVSKLGQLLLLLEGHDIPCNRLLTSKNGDMLTEHLGKPVMLKSYIPGQVHNSLDVQMLDQVGAQVAKLNQIRAPDYLPTQHPYGYQLFPKVTGLNIDSKYELWLKNEKDYLERHIPDGLPKGLIHGDLFYDNLLFENGSFKAIIDFEEASRYTFVFELGMGIVGSCTTGNAINLDKARALIMGYQKVRQLEPLEKESLQMHVQYAAAATSYWRFNKYNIEEPRADRANHHWKMAEIARAVTAIPKASFFDAIFNA